MNAGKVSCALDVHQQTEQFLSNWEVYLCLAQFKAKDAWTPQLDACRAAAQVAGSCRERFATDQELSRHVTVFRSLARNFKLTAKTKPELAKLFKHQDPAVAETQLRGETFPFDFVALTRSGLSAVSPQTGDNIPKVAVTHDVDISEEQGTRYVLL